MNKKNKNIFGHRLKLARRMAGFSMQELANALENKVTKQALSKYENGLMNPSAEVVFAISKVFNLKPDYFLKKKSVELGNVSFRKRARLSKKNEESIIEIVRDYVERFLEIENILGTETQLENPIKEIVVKDKQDADTAAQKLREKWNLGGDSISNLVEMLELQGIKVLLIETVDDFDGLAVFSSNGIPIVAVNTKGKPIERIRFTIIHELAHLMLLFDKNINFTGKNIEVLCHYFSSCFLIPTTVLVKMIRGKRKYIRINELVSIKESYGISIRAIVYRLRDLRLITDDYYRRWVVYMSKTFGSKEEPGSYKGEEKPKTFDRLINQALAEELITVSKAAALWNVGINEIRKGYSGK